MPASSSNYITPSSHAAERYQERVRPTLDVPAAEIELARLLGGAEPTAAPEWIADSPDADAYAILSDGICAPLKRTGDGWVATTVLARAVPSAPARERRNLHNSRQRRAKRARNRKGSRNRRQRDDR